MADFLAVLDTPGIKRFVFGTSRLREVQGASALLDWLDRHLVPSVLKQRIEQSGGVFEPVYFAGGGGQFFARQIEAEQLAGALRAAAAEVRRRSGDGACVVWGVTDAGAGYAEAVRAAHGALRHRRQAARALSAVSTFPLARECESASSEPAAEFVDLGGERSDPALGRGGSGRGEAWVGPSTGRKRQEALRARRQRGGLWARLRSDLGGREFLDKAEDLVGADEDAAAPVALLYADGDGMGKLVQAIDGPSLFARFSKACDDAVRAAFCEACSVAFAYEEHPEVPVVPLLLGGDDVVAYVRGSHALRFAAALSRAFSRIVREGYGSELVKLAERVGGGLTLSIGIAVARPKQPFQPLLRQAEHLLEQAKRRRAELVQAGKHSAAAARMVAMLWSTPANVTDPTDAWELLTLRTEAGAALQRTLFPCTVERLERLMELAEALRDTMPTSRRQALWEAAMAPTRLDAELRALEVLGRAARGARRVLEEARASLGDGSGITGGTVSLPAPWTPEGKTFFADLHVICELGTEPASVSSVGASEEARS